MSLFREEYRIALIALTFLIVVGCEENNTTLAPESGSGPTSTAPNQELPRIVGAISTSNTTVLVSFSKQMADSATDTQNYVIVQENVNSEAGALIVAAADFSGPDMTAVELTTLSQNELTYRVTISNMRDIDGNPLSSPTNQGGVLVDPTSATFPGTPPSTGQLVDSDGDGLADNIEQRGWVVSTVLTSGDVRQREVTSDPFAADSDQDGITDDVELQRASDPRAPDTDADGIDDMDEIRTYFSSPTRQDTDGDRVSDSAEINRNRTSPISADTDGDNFSDYEEIFDRSTDPLIANIPLVELEMVGEIDIFLNTEYEDSEGTTETTNSSLEVESTDQSETKETLVGRTILSAWDEAKVYIEAQTGISIPTPAVLAGGEPPKERVVSAIAAGVVAVGSFAGSQGKGALGYVSSQQPTYTTTSIDRTKEESSVQRQANRNRVEKTSSGEISIGLKVRNKGDVSFTLNNLVFTLLQRDPVTRDSFKTLATLNLADEIRDGVTLGAFNAETGVLRVDKADASASLVKDLLANPTGLYLEVGTFDLLDAFGRNFAFLNEVTNARTALVMIDFGNGRVDRARVATDVARKPDGTAAGISLGEVLGRILEVDFETAPREDDVDAEVLVRIGEQSNQEDGTSFWFLMTSSERLLEPEVDFDDTVLESGDTMIIAYVTDVDGDGLFAREEFLYGTKDSDPDTDGDGISDFDEVKVGWDITLGETTRVYSDPLSADSDRDGLTDIEERDAAMTGVGIGPTDPNSPDTDGDGLCDGPGRLDNNSTDEDSPYYDCRVGAGRDLRPLEPRLTTPPNLLVVVPLPNDLVAEPEVDILGRFTQKLEENSTFSVFGSMTGFRFGDFFFADPLTLVFNPDLPFQSGETVDVIFNDSLVNIDGLPFDFDPDTVEPEAFTYRFWTQVTDTGSDGEFATDWYALTENPFAVTVADFDGDGSMDIATATEGSDDVSILLNNTSGEFLPPTTYPVSGNSPRSIAAADFNGDGRPDLATGNAFSDPGVSVLINNGNGSFGAAVPYIVENRPNQIVAADFNGDGLIDLVTANRNPDNFDPDPDNIAVLLNVGDGVFAAAISFPTGDSDREHNVSAGDFDGDSDLDVAVTNHLDTSVFGVNAIDQILVLFNDGSGAFSAPVAYDAGNNIADIIAADLNGDDNVDLTVSNFSPDEVQVLLNQGDGTFGPATPYAAQAGLSTTPVEIVAVDLDQDGDLDIATSNRRDSVSVLINDGNGVLALPRIYLAGDSPTDIAAADFDDDGDNDLVTTHQISDDVLVHKNDGTGAFPTTFVGDSPADITAADFDGDGDLDLLTANENSDDVSLVLNDGNGGFADAVPYPVTGFGAGRMPSEAVAADLDGDGDMDVATASTETNNVSVMLNDGTAFFGEAIQYPVSDQPYDITVADFDGDGDLDLATTSFFSDDIAFLRNNGDGTFADALLTSVGSNPSDLQPADLDGDGDVDLALPNAGRNKVEIFLNTGEGAFALDAQYDVGADPFALVATDLDGDGDIDLATINRGSADVSILLNEGDATFSGQRRVPATPGPVDIAAADIDGDGDLDLAVVGNGMNNLEPMNDVVYIVNEGQGRFVRRDASRVGDAPSAITAADLDGDGDLELATSNRGSNSITVLKNGGLPP